MIIAIRIFGDITPRQKELLLNDLQGRVEDMELPFDFEVVED